MPAREKTLSPQEERRERMLRRAVERIQTEGGDWRTLAKRLGVDRRYARLLWRRVLTGYDPRSAPPASPTGSRRKPKDDLRFRAL